MVNIANVLAQAASATAIAMPQGTDTTGFQPNGPHDSTTSITYHEPGSKYHSCTTVVGQSTLQSMFCTPLKGGEVSIGEKPEGNCIFTLFEGTNTCDVLGDGSNKKDFSIPNGNKEFCVTNARFNILAENGKASGVWTCA